MGRQGCFDSDVEGLKSIRRANFGELSKKTGNLVQSRGIGGARRAETAGEGVSVRAKRMADAENAFFMLFFEAYRLRGGVSTGSE